MDYERYASDQLLHKNSLTYTNIQHSTQRLMGMAGRAGVEHFKLRHYTCAPTSYMLGDYSFIAFLDFAAPKL